MKQGKIYHLCRNGRREIPAKPPGTFWKMRVWILRKKNFKNSHGWGKEVIWFVLSQGSPPPPTLTPWCRVGEQEIEIQQKK